MTVFEMTIARINDRPMKEAHSTLQACVTHSLKHRKDPAVKSIEIEKQNITIRGIKRLGTVWRWTPETGVTKPEPVPDPLK